MSTIDYSLLNARFGLRGQITFKDGPEGIAVVEVANAHATATLALQGAHVMRWTPRKQRPVLWLSPAAKFGVGKSIRGGVPVCWPWFGPHATQENLPSHGFARAVPWAVVATHALPDGSTHLSLQLTPTDATRAQWPHTTDLRLHIKVGVTLEMALVTRNTDDHAIVIGEALHSYFAVSDVRQIALHG